MASVWSPSIEIKIADVSIDIGAEIVGIGAGVYGSNNELCLKFAYGYGGKISIKWDN